MTIQCHGHQCLVIEWFVQRIPAFGDARAACVLTEDGPMNLVWDFDRVVRVNPEPAGLHTHYTLLCDDIRLEVGNRLSLIGMFQSITTGQLPISLIKLAVITYWHGQGTGSAEVRILSPDRSAVIVVSNATQIELPDGGFTHNLVFFVNVVLPQEGLYWVQTLLDSEVVDEVPFAVVLHQHDFA